ncbi:membrane metalloprotease [Cellulophaga omnivescoria]|uniref:membrane metalloprotease n=1 Tax=Cellulophaga omnivescoria TaxID=1888890 RepID=UPI0009872862|nr:membrane metalloprotease [Cellulophaga omnivescoria]
MTFKTIVYSILICSSFIACSTDSESTPSFTNDNNEIITDEIKERNRKNVGSSANDLLSNTTYKSTVIEIFYVKDFKPTDETIENFKNFITERLNKSKGWELRLEEITVPAKTSYTADDIIAMENNLRTQYNTDDKIAVFGIYLDAEYANNTEEGSVLGIAYQNTSFAVFENTVKEFSNKPLAPSRTVLSSTVLNHEFGHLLGLVNNGSTMQTSHQDTAHGKHCNVENCLMYWTAETGEGLLNSITEGKIPTLDAQCIADLQANGGK